MRRYCPSVPPFREGSPAGGVNSRTRTFERRRVNKAPSPAFLPKTKLRLSDLRLGGREHFSSVSLKHRNLVLNLVLLITPNLPTAGKK